MYNLTGLQNVTGIYSLVLYANDVTGGVFLIGFMLAIFFVMLLQLKRWDFQNAFLVSCWIAFVISGILTYAKLLPLILPLLFLFLTAVAVFMSFFSQR